MSVLEPRVLRRGVDELLHQQFECVQELVLAGVGDVSPARLQNRAREDLGEVITAADRPQVGGAGGDVLSVAAPGDGTAEERNVRLVVDDDVGVGQGVDVVDRR